MGGEGWGSVGSVHTLLGTSGTQIQRNKQENINVCLHFLNFFLNQAYYYVLLCYIYIHVQVHVIKMCF